jgi:hypothetical protein
MQASSATAIKSATKATLRISTFLVPDG